MKKKIKQLACVFLAAGMIFTSGGVSVLAESTETSTVLDAAQAVKAELKSGDVILMKEGDTLKLGEGKEYFRIVKMEGEIENTIFPKDDTKGIAKDQSSELVYTKAKYVAEKPSEGKLWQLTVKEDTAVSLEIKSENKTENKTPFTLTIEEIDEPKKEGEGTQEDVQSEFPAQEQSEKLDQARDGEVAAPVIDQQPSSAEYEKDAETVTPLAVAATAAEGGTLSYQWYKADTAEVEGTPVEGAVENTYTPAVDTPGTIYYYCGVKSKSGENESQEIFSNRAAITVTETGEEPVQPVIEKQPVSASYEQGADSVTPLSVIATVTDGGTLSYQWFKASASDAEGTEISGASDSTYTPQVDTVGISYYYCVVKNTLNEKTSQGVKSDVVSVTVKEKSADSTPEGEVKNAAEPKVSGPKDATYKVGTDSEEVDYMEVKATASDGGKLTYQWYKNSKNSTEGAKALTGATSNIFKPSAKRAGTNYYFCIVTNTNEKATDIKTKSVTSRIAKITITGEGTDSGKTGKTTVTPVAKKKTAATTTRKKSTQATKAPTRSTTKKASNAKTGDENNMTIWVIGLAAAGAVTAELILKRRKRNMK